MNALDKAQANKIISCFWNKIKENLEVLLLKCSVKILFYKISQNLRGNTWNGVLFSGTMKSQPGILNTFWKIFQNRFSGGKLMTDVSVNHFQNSRSRLWFDLWNFLVCNVSESRPIFAIYPYNHKVYWPEKEWPIDILEKKLSWEILKNS